MPLEVATSIEQLDSSYPLGGDPTNRGDDHLRLIKSVLKTTFPGAGGLGLNAPILATEAELNSLQGVTSNIQTQLNNVSALVNAVKQEIYPIGSIYTNATNATNPATLLGFGTWAKFGEGRVQVGHSTTDPLFDTAEEIGGSKDATLPSHSHNGNTSTTGNHQHVEGFSNTGANATGGYGATNGASAPKYVQTAFANTGPSTADHNLTSAEGIHSHTFTTALTGESATNKNLQPYITVYMWKRTA